MKIRTLMRRLLLFLVGATLLLVLGAGLMLWLAHRHIDTFAPKLPALEDLAKLGTDGKAPIRISYINTASQVMPRAAVLEPSVDPASKIPYVMSHAAFVLEWPDGRLFLVDAGMDAEAARAFGSPMEYLADAEPLVPKPALADVLGESATRVAGIGFTHLHTDHTQGIDALCRERHKPHAGRDSNDHPLSVFVTPPQNEEHNYTTRQGWTQIERASCTEIKRLNDGSLTEIPGFPGLAVFNAAGHTPGSQIFAVRVNERLYLLVGDLVNHIEGLRQNWPKPHLYSRFVVPENTEHLARVRQAVRAYAERLNAQILVTHDQRALEEAIAPYRAIP